MKDEIMKMVSESYQQGGIDAIDSILISLDELDRLGFGINSTDQFKALLLIARGKCKTPVVKGAGDDYPVIEPQNWK